MRSKSRFQSTPPVKAATLSFSFRGGSVIFQSTPPVKAATKLIFYFYGFIAFQSTPPVKAATCRDFQRQRSGGISIHAAREGGDVFVLMMARNTAYFNPRRP